MPSKDGDRESEESRKRKARSEMIEKIPVMALAGNRRNKVDLTLLGHSFRMLLEFGAGVGGRFSPRLKMHDDELEKIKR